MIHRRFLVTCTPFGQYLLEGSDKGRMMPIGRLPTLPFLFDTISRRAADWGWADYDIHFATPADAAVLRWQDKIRAPTWNERQIMATLRAPARDDT